MLRSLRLGPELLDIDARINTVVKSLREAKFLEGTRFETRAMEQGMDPYSILLGFLLGVAATIIMGLLTLEIWVPKAIARMTGKTITETTKAVREALGVKPT